MLHAHSGLINLDYFFITVLACGFTRRLASVLFVITYSFEAARLLDSVYFFSQQDLPFAAQFVADAPKTILLAWCVVLFAVIAVPLQIWRLLIPLISGLPLCRAAVPLAFASLLLITIDVEQGFNPLQRLPHGLPRPHLVGELLVRMPVEILRAPHGHDVTTELTFSGTQPLWTGSHIRAQRQDILIVVVESMGLLQNEAAANKQFALFTDPALRQRYVVERGAVPFHGATIAGETRELCHLGTGVHITADTLDGKHPCLPRQFRDLGYQTSAYHGYLGTMFNRGDWYRRVGFSEVNFLKQLGGIAMCNGAFYGACDTAVADLLRKRLKESATAAAPPQFLYWMTLNGHLPVDVTRSPRSECPVDADHEVCAQLGYTNEVLEAVKHIATDDLIRPTAIVVVGDHPPPYLSSERRSLFDGERVPYLTLLPRSR